MPTRIFVTGTGPGVGKTVCGAGLLRRMYALGQKVAGVKVVETGCGEARDHDLLGRDAEILNGGTISIPLVTSSPYRFSIPAVAAVAAERAGTELLVDDLCEAVELAESYADIILVEGSVGALSPIATDGLELDLVAALSATLVVCAPDALASQSQVLSIIECARQRAIEIAAVVLTGPADPGDNARMIRERGGVPVFGPIHVRDDREALITAVELEMESWGIAELLLDAAARP